MSHGGLGQGIFDWSCCRIANNDRRNRDDGARTRRLKSGSADDLAARDVGGRLCHVGLNS